MLLRSGRYKPAQTAGLAAAVAAFGVLAWNIGAEPRFIILEPAIFVLGLGLGLVLPNMTIAVQNALPAAHRGVGTATLTFFRSLGGLIGVAGGGAILAIQMHRVLKPAATLTTENHALLIAVYQHAIATVFHGGGLHGGTRALRNHVPTGGASAAIDGPGLKHARRRLCQPGAPFTVALFQLHHYRTLPPCRQLLIMSAVPLIEADLARSIGIHHTEPASRDGLERSVISISDHDVLVVEVHGRGGRRVSTHNAMATTRPFSKTFTDPGRGNAAG